MYQRKFIVWGVIVLCFLALMSCNPQMQNRYWGNLRVQTVVINSSCPINPETQRLVQYRLNKNDLEKFEMIMDSADCHYKFFTTDTTAYYDLLHDYIYFVESTGNFVEMKVVYIPDIKTSYKHSTSIHIEPHELNGEPRLTIYR